MNDPASSGSVLNCPVAMLVATGDKGIMQAIEDLLRIARSDLSLAERQNEAAARIQKFNAEPDTGGDREELCRQLAAAFRVFTNEGNSFAASTLEHARQELGCDNGVR